MRHATCTRWARWSLEEVLNMPDQFDSRSQLFFYLSSYRFRTEIFPFFCFVLILDYQMLFCYIISFNILLYINFVIYPMSDIMLSAEKATSPTAFINTLLLKRNKIKKNKWWKDRGKLLESKSTLTSTLQSSERTAIIVWAKFSYR